jgi:hypothetical protein
MRAAPKRIDTIHKHLEDLKSSRYVGPYTEILDQKAAAEITKLENWKQYFINSNS